MKNGSVIYFCARTSKPSDDIETFAKPVSFTLKPMYLTIQPAGGFMDNQVFGEFTDMTHKGYASPYEKWFGVFKEGDRLYLGNVPDGLDKNEEPTEGWGYDADAQIIAVKPQNRVIALTIRNIVR